MTSLATEINAFYVKEKSDKDENVTVDEIDKTVLTRMARFGKAEISPVASFFGAIVSQEIIKYTGKFMPLR